MIEIVANNLRKGEHLLQNISESQYKNTTVAPYNSSIGSHIRHVMDMFHCIFEGLELGEIDLTARQRNRRVEEELEMGLLYIHNTISKLKTLHEEKFSQIVFVVDDLGAGKVRAEYTLAGILFQAHSHATHHYASIGYIIHQLGIELPDDTFGFNPTTPKKEIINS